MSEYRSYTRGERAERARLVLRGVEQAAASAVDSRIEKRIERIDAVAADRGAREADALFAQDDRAKNELAAAKARERAARGEDRRAARDARRQAEQRVRATERAIRRAGL
ncbi:hypothetical protein ACFOSC_26480 [Streptantibioticus rubrisoli]|uniref:Uncharacterized protein n=1 Tax=Streptantibioticus rubrisoli TaxID=1387313 RepID=A0ABT1PHU5_9ACTN|nr:hypothetical protein [Streptantibioticus rubrisoli]MCQ4043875.1 hypothetical protein [Streptantibioticus rubrisoli]